MRIGHSNQSQTFVPQVETAAGSFGDAVAFADCPGFIDSRGFEINISNAVNVRQTVAAAASCVVVVIINYFSLLADRGKGIKDLMQILGGLFGTPEDVRAHARSVLLVISQAPARHPESGASITLGQHARKLLDPTGLDEDGRKTLGALGTNVCVYHLLGRGDASWLDRSAIIDRINELEPITTPASLFRSAIAEHDKESLREMVTSLCAQVSSSMAFREYQWAADQVSDLLEIKNTQSDFVNAIIDEAVTAAVVSERTRIVRAAVDRCLVSKKDGSPARGSPAQGDGRGDADDRGGGTDGSSDDDPSHRGVDREIVQNDDGFGQCPNPTDDSSLRFTEARRQLHELAVVLEAFAGIAGISEQLAVLLATSTLDLEKASRRAAELAGRKLVEEPVRELLRTVGGNVVKEVLLLPHSAEKMRISMMAERDELDQLFAEEIRSFHGDQVGDVGTESVEQLEMMKERFVVDLLELDLRADGACSAWKAHMDNAAERLMRRDKKLLEDEGASFWERVGSSKSACFGDRDPSTSTATVLDWARRRLSDEHCEVIGAVLRSVDSARVSALFLSGNQIGDSGVSALADATGFGALPNLERLFLDNNQFGDEATVDLARAFVTGRLSKLTFLDLNRNRIADEGMAALAKAVAAGALENIATLYLHKNAIGDAGALAFVDAITGVTSQEQSRGVIVHGMRRARKVPSLCKLYLGENCIGEAGLAALRRAHAGGAMPALEILQLDGNTTTAKRWAQLE